jgi:stalled ribosome alternative rescue factor ArfA
MARKPKAPKRRNPAAAALRFLRSTVVRGRKGKGAYSRKDQRKEIDA